MRYSLRVLAWLLVGMGAVISILTGLSLAGFLTLPINVFGQAVETSTARAWWLVGWLFGAALGLVLLRVVRLKPPAPRPKD